MANRSSLYGFDKFVDGKASAPVGMQEWNYEIPLSQLILASGRPRVQASTIHSSRIAVVGDFDRGKARLVALLQALLAGAERGEVADVEPFKAAVLQTIAFLDTCNHKMVLLEAGEIFALQKAEPEKQVATLVATTLPALAAKVDALLEAPEKLLKGRLPTWLSAIRKNWRTADAGLEEWSTVLYHQPS